MATINLCKVSFDEHTLRSVPTSYGKTLEGKIYNPLNVVNPTVEVKESDISDYNLIRIPINHRWYWIKDIEFIGEGYTAKLHCESAVLLNYYENIINSNAILVDTTNFYDKQLISNNYPIEAQRRFSNQNPFKRLPYKDCYILTTLGGGDTTVDIG